MTLASSQTTSTSQTNISLQKEKGKTSLVANSVFKSRWRKTSRK